VAALAARARNINDRNLDTRLPVPLAKDEISDLSRTLNQMLERIEKAFASVRTFTGNASHELRTPIALLRTEIEVALYRTRDGGEYRKVLHRLHEEAMRMTGLVENLLSLARADSCAEAIVLVPIRIVALLKQMDEAWRATMNNAMLDFNVEIPNQDLLVLGDTHGIPRLLPILLENASKYTPPCGTGKVCSATDGQQVILSVSNSGPGIAPEHLQRIFDRFYRAPQTGTAVQAGSGLGLALGKWIAERHNSVLSVESDPQRGTCFSFMLQRVATDVYAADRSNAPQASLTAAAPI
jgi:signal transduction histidine kinase